MNILKHARQMKLVQISIFLHAYKLYNFLDSSLILKWYICVIGLCIRFNFKKTTKSFVIAYLFHFSFKQSTTDYHFRRF